ncbi:MAG: hypothetical protein D8M59_06715 [Planctomycetes bacterium]|nr:hypothetical protein [Planctomycetota bacterium]
MPQPSDISHDSHALQQAISFDGAIWTKQRSELRKWFEDRAPTLTDAYTGCVLLLYMPAFPARVHFICHAVRDIYVKLPASLGIPQIKRPAEVFPEMVKAFSVRWHKYPPKTINSSSEDTLFAFADPLYRYAKKMVDTSDSMKRVSVGTQLASALFQCHDRGTSEFIPKWVVDSFDREYKFFVKRAHLVPDVEKLPSHDGLVEHFQAFERTFHSLTCSYFEGKEEVDAILRRTNTTRH